MEQVEQNPGVPPLFGREPQDRYLSAQLASVCATTEQYEAGDGTSTLHHLLDRTVCTAIGIAINILTAKNPVAGFAENRFPPIAEESFRALVPGKDPLFPMAGERWLGCRGDGLDNALVHF